MSSDLKWAELDGFPDYAVSNYGNVVNTRLNHELRPRPNSYGYLKVILRKDGKSYERLVHRLVAEQFASGYTDSVKVTHADGDVSNNYIYNLRFLGNRRMGRLLSGSDRIQSRRVEIIETGQTFLNVSECAKYISGDTSTIYSVLNGKRVSHKGYSFRFIGGIR